MHPIFYDPRQSVDGVDSYSPSAGKPAAFMEQLKRTTIQRSFSPVSKEDLYRVHSRSYVDDVFSGAIVNGFECRDDRVPQACLWTIGSMYSAARHVTATGGIACSPTSGFHHAGYNFGGGFCTFNGLAVSAAMLIEEFYEYDPSFKVGILDCDFHFGDGTQDIIKNNPALTQCVVHHTSGQFFHDRGDADEFFMWLEESIADLNRQQCDVVLYQAGADMHIDDPLGGFLDDAEMRQRDRTVFRKINTGIAWNLAGGYRKPRKDGSNPVIETHLNTLAESIFARR